MRGQIPRRDTCGLAQHPDTSSLALLHVRQATRPCGSPPAHSAGKPPGNKE